MIGERIRQARLAADLTLDALGERVGVTHTAIQKYEKGVLTPSSSQLIKLARACGVRVEYFFRTTEVKLLHPEFRKTAAFGKAAQESACLKVTRELEKRVELLGHFPESPLLQFAPPAGLPGHLATIDEIEAVAETVRSAWQLGMNPIPDLTDTLETLGLMVIVVDEPHAGFSGLTAEAQSGGGQTYPVVAVSSQWPGDRQRFTLAHELGHLLLAGRLADDIDEEKACDRFAGAFLAPKFAVMQLLGAHRRWIEWQELYALKHEFGLSMAGWLQRAFQCGVITEATRLTLWKLFSKQGWRKQEPGDVYPAEHPRLFEQLVYRGLAEDYLSEAKAAELLGVPMMLFHKQRHLDFADAAAHQ